MATLPLDNPYALLALFLSPCEETAAAEPLFQAAERKELDWGALLHRANLNFCTPLWYVRMRQAGFLPLLPDELQEYLALLHQANVERNEAFRLALKDLLRTFQSLGIRSLLLKGAVTFCDDLYEDPGARMMGDLDILVEPHASEKARTALLDLGYEQQLDREQGKIEVFSGNLHHHLPRFNLPGTPVAVEIHIRTARRQDGRTLPDDLAWAGSEKATVDGCEAVVLSPTHRLLHNTVQALVPQRNFIRSTLSLGHLAEFAFLARKYHSSIDWNEWFQRGISQKLGLEFSVYLALANRLMGMPLPDCGPKYPTARIHIFRFLLAEKYLPSAAGSPSSARARILTKALIKFFYHVKEPIWLWRNLFYAPGVANLPLRIAYTVRKLARGGIGFHGPTGEADDGENA